MVFKAKWIDYEIAEEIHEKTEEALKKTQQDRFKKTPPIVY
jgi:hypothetical protein